MFYIHVQQQQEAYRVKYMKMLNCLSKKIASESFQQVENFTTCIFYINAFIRSYTTKELGIW